MASERQNSHKRSPHTPAPADKGMITAFVILVIVYFIFDLFIYHEGGQNSTAHLLISLAVFGGFPLIRRLWLDDVSVNQAAIYGLGLGLLTYAMFAAAALSTLVSPITYFRSHLFDGFGPAIVVGGVLAIINPFRDNPDRIMPLRLRCASVALAAVVSGLIGSGAVFTADPTHHVIQLTTQTIVWLVFSGAALGWIVTTPEVPQRQSWLRRTFRV